jgi:hypothetical protein
MNPDCVSASKFDPAHISVYRNDVICIPSPDRESADWNDIQQRMGLRGVTAMNAPQSGQKRVATCELDHSAPQTCGLSSAEGATTDTKTVGGRDAGDDDSSCVGLPTCMHGATGHPHKQG